jgi:predicted membrane-bound spermidine synthase
MIVFAIGWCGMIVFAIGMIIGIFIGIEIPIFFSENTRRKRKLKNIHRIKK